MNIYSFINSIPDYVSNPLTAINVMIMISSLKDKFGDKIHGTTRKGYLTTQDMIPYKYYKLYLWYWCDECTYGIRECTAKDFNIKEEDEMDISKMTKEEALKKIEELKEYVEKCEEKEKEIPEMPRRGNYNVHIAVPDELHDQYSSWERSFENEESSDLYCILSFELANLIYVRHYLGTKSIDIDEAGPPRNIWYIWFCPADKLYHWSCYLSTLLLPHMESNDAFNIWCFTNEDDANRVRDYMNKYVAHVKKNMF